MDAGTVREQRVTYRSWTSLWWFWGLAMLMLVWIGTGCRSAVGLDNAAHESAPQAQTADAELSIAALAYNEALPKMIVLERQAILDPTFRT